MTLDDLNCSGCGEYVGSHIGDQIDSLNAKVERMRRALKIGLHALTLSNMPMTSLVRNEAIAELQAILQPEETAK